jgi:pyruvate formate lyase activating enzyme
MGENTEEFKRAVLWEEAGDKKVRCRLCSWRCLIAEGKCGHCMVRKNIGGVLYSLNYDRVCSGNVDPIEKKPLFHFQPGSRSFSIACMGCNFQCEFCQNWQISQAAMVSGKIDGEEVAPESIVAEALRSKCRSIAYTYTEPTIFMELCEETGKIAKENRLANVFVSNGYQTKEAIDFSKGWLDAINVDLKAFTEDFYRRLCKAHIQPVLDMIKYIAKETNIWMEITTLVIPGENDSDDELKRIAEFIANEAGADVPWHVSRFYPQYKMDGLGPTPAKTLERAMEIGRAAGLHYVYVGNLPGSQAESTLCYRCGKMLIHRVGYSILRNEVKGGECPGCGTKVAGFEL